VNKGEVKKVWCTRNEEKGKTRDVLGKKERFIGMSK